MLKKLKESWKIQSEELKAVNDEMEVEKRSTWNAEGRYYRAESADPVVEKNDLR